MEKYFVVIHFVVKKQKITSYRIKKLIKRKAHNGQ